MDFLELLESNINDAYKTMTASVKEDVLDNYNEYNNDRKIRNGQVGKRQDKVVGKDVTTVAKIPIPFQRKIVRSAASFLFGSRIKLVPSEKNDAAQALKNLWKDTRMDSLLLKFATAVKSETEAAIVLFPVEKEGQDTKIKARLLSSETGKIYPVLDSFGDMVAFGWEYQTVVNDEEIGNLYIWTAEHRYIFKGKSGSWSPADEEPKTENSFGKIPVVYLSQEKPEWWEVVDLIDNFEMSFSKFVDTNGYFASPMYKAKGGVKSMPKKDETGKMVKLDIIETDKGNVIEADLEVISWDRAPEALKLEFETSRDLIYHMTDTTDISKLVSSGIGSVSGIALKLMFFSSILKSYWDQGDYLIAIDRILNVMKAGISNILESKYKTAFQELNFDIMFTSVLPENVKEVIEVLSEATGGKAVMSQKTAISHNPLVANNDEELEAIEAEVASEKIDDLGSSQEL